MREEFRKNKRFGKIFKALDGDIDAKSWGKITDDDATELASFLEEIAVLVQSGVLPSKLVSYFFGYYAIEIVDNTEFMKKIDPTGQEPYWQLLRRFAEMMKKEQEYLKKSDAGTQIIPRLRV